MDSKEDHKKDKNKMNINKHSKVRAVGLSSFFALFALLGVAVFCPGGNEANAADQDSKTMNVNFGLAPLSESDKPTQISDAETFKVDFNLVGVASETKTAQFYVNFLVAQKISIEMNDLASEIVGKDTAGNTTIQPTKDGTQVTGYDDFTVKTNSPAGLKAFVYSANGKSELVGTASEANVIPATATEATLQTLTANTWGYNLSPASDSTAEIKYKGLKTAQDANSPDYTMTNQGEETLRLSFGAKVGNGLASDTYENTVNVFVVPTAEATSAATAYSLQAEKSRE